jgi:hypothetical protein
MIVWKVEGKRTGRRHIASCSVRSVEHSNVIPSIALLVLEALGDTDDQVVLRRVSPLYSTKSAAKLRVGLRKTYDDGSDSSEGGDALSRSMVEFDLDEVLLGLREPLVHILIHIQLRVQHTCVKLTER